MKKNERIIVSVMSLLFIGTLLWTVFMVDNLNDYYRTTYKIIPILLQTFLVKPTMYLTGGFFGTYFIARKAFRDDLLLPYKLFLGIGVGFVMLYVLLVVGYGFLQVRMLTHFFMYFTAYFQWTMIIPGILIALATEHHYRS